MQGLVQHPGVPTGFLPQQWQDVQRTAGRGEGRTDGAAETAGTGARSDQTPAGGGQVSNPGQQN